MAGVDFVLVLWVVGFMAAMWLVGRVFKLLRQPAIVGYLLTGILLGPNFLDIVPYASDGTCETMVVSHLPADTSHARMLAAAAPTDGNASSAAPHVCSHIPWQRWNEGEHIVPIWTFVGNVGVTMMIFQSGMHIHFDKVRQVGRKAFVVAIVGTFLPLLTGMGLVGLLFDEFYPSGFAAGCAFAPTSIDISIKLLEEAKMLNSLAGQTTITAAFIDDIFALATLVMMTSLGNGEASVGSVILLIACAFGFLGIGVLLAIYVFSRLPPLLAKIPPKKQASIQPRDEVHLTIMIITLCTFAWLTSTEIIGSHLLGAFVAGMCFVNVPRSQALWQGQFKRITKWMIRFFFAASVGFAVPVGAMFRAETILNGFLLGVGPCISTKIVSGAFAYTRYASESAKERARGASWATKLGVQPQQMLVGMAMVARGEFAYMVAETAQAAEYKVRGADGVIRPTGRRMMRDEVYASVVWALVMATICSPLLFRWALAVYGRATPIVRSKTIGGVDPSMMPDPPVKKANSKKKKQKGDATQEGASNPSAIEEGAAENEMPSIDLNALRHLGKGFRIRIASRHHIGVQRELLDCLHGAGVDVLEAQVYCVNHPSTSEVDAFVASYVVASRGAKKDFDDEKLEEMQHELLEVLDDKDSQVIFEPYDDDFSNDGVLEVQVLVTFHPDVLHEITDALALMHLDVLKADVTHSKQLAHGTTALDGHGHTTMEINDAQHGHYSSATRNDDGTPRSGGSFKKRRDSKEQHDNAPSAASTAYHEQEIEEARERAAGFADGVAFYAIEEKERGVFYAREADGTHQFSSKRRAEIQQSLEHIIHDHGVQGTITLRVVHENEMQAHVKPKFDHEERVTLIKCVGEHHMELLHEIFDMLHDEDVDVLHAEMDTDAKGTERHALYVARRDNLPSTRDQRTTLRGKINTLYLAHGKDDETSVTVLPMRGVASEGELIPQRRPSTDTTPDFSPHPLSSRTRGKASPPMSPTRGPTTSPLASGSAADNERNSAGGDASSTGLAPVSSSPGANHAVAPPAVAAANADALLPSSIVIADSSAESGKA